MLSKNARATEALRDVRDSMCDVVSTPTLVFVPLRDIAQVASDVRDLDTPGFLARAQQVAQVDNIAEKLKGHIEKLSSLVVGLTVSSRLRDVSHDTDDRLYH